MCVGRDIEQRQETDGEKEAKGHIQCVCVCVCVYIRAFGMLDSVQHRMSVCVHASQGETLCVEGLILSPLPSASVGQAPNDHNSGLAFLITQPALTERHKALQPTEWGVEGGNKNRTFASEVWP